MKALRRLCPPQLRAVDRFADHAILDALDRVAERQAGIAAGAWSSASRTRSISCASGNGRAPSWISTRCGIVADECFKPEPHRILPLGTSGDRRHHSEARRRRIEQRAVLGPDRDQDACDARVLGERGDCVAQDGAAAERQVLLGHPPPNRVPRPAATTSAKTALIARKLDRAAPGCQSPAGGPYQRDRIDRVSDKAAEQAKEYVELVVVHPMSGALDRNDPCVLEILQPRVLFRVPRPAFLAVDEQGRTADPAPQLLNFALAHPVG